MVGAPLVHLLEAEDLGDFWYVWWRLRVYVLKSKGLRSMMFRRKRLCKL